MSLAREPERHFKTDARTVVTRSGAELAAAQRSDEGSLRTRYPNPFHDSIRPQHTSCHIKEKQEECINIKAVTCMHYF